MNDLKACIETYSNGVWNAKDSSAVDQLFTEESVIHSPLQTLTGASAMKEIIEVWLAAFPDLVVDHVAFVQEGDTVVSRWKANGTHRGLFRGIEATAVSVSYEGVSIYRFAGEKVTDYWAFVNLHHITDQIVAGASEKLEAPALAI